MVKKVINLWLPPLLWMGVIFILSSIPHLQTTSDPFWNFVTRKLAHIFEYSVLSFLILRAFGFRKPLLSLFLSLLYSLSDEYHQTFVLSRTGKFSDIIFDLVGILLGIYILTLGKLFLSERLPFLLTQKWKKLLILSKKPKI